MQALRIEGTPGQEAALFPHSQLADCVSGIVLSGSGVLIRANNCLFANVGAPLDEQNSSSYYGNWSLVHCTIDSSSQVLASVSSGSVLNCTNCVFANVGSAGIDEPSADYNVFYASTAFGSDSTTLADNPFLTAGSGGRYLAAGARLPGTASIDTNLLASLRQKTVEPPVEIWSQDVTLDTTLFPQARRDKDASPTMGYHYNPADYVILAMRISNSVVKVLPGTVLATAGVYGFTPQPGAQFICQGLPNSLCRIVRHNLIMEHANTTWDTLGASFYGPWNAASGASLTFRFTDWSMPAQEGYHLTTSAQNIACSFTDCQFHGGKFLQGLPSLYLTNCLFEAVNTTIDDADWGADVTPIVQNCSFIGGQVTLNHWNSDVWSVHDSLFANVTTTQDGDISPSYNAYTVGAFHFTPTNSHDLVVTNLDFVSGPLSPYMYPTNGGNLSRLINAGSQGADLAHLYHYTVVTNLVSGLWQLKETNSVVEIGAHAPAANALGQVSDVNGDGIIDLLQDLNGNGTVDSGEASWTTYTSPNGLATGSGLQVFTPLKP